MFVLVEGGILKSKRFRLCMHKFSVARNRATPKSVIGVGHNTACRTMATGGALHSSLFCLQFFWRWLRQMLPFSLGILLKIS